ncbi:hypothetical protein QVD17_23261 [Tagetes erecta]|uniref:Peptidase C1A papain C-terminal domain-containing protein n=1 Tax=Tagetes erecta TaxID=13708 RepID=A0AAD8NM65_TARER|nr:hypothetical protein QVD17_23261 [Tagetes erecta]
MFLFVLAVLCFGRDEVHVLIRPTKPDRCDFRSEREEDRMEWKDDLENEVGVVHSVADCYTEVWDQEDAPLCLAFAATHMLTILWRRRHEKYKNIILSPQRIIDARCRCMKGLRGLLMEGLHTLKDQQFSRLRKVESEDLTDRKYNVGNLIHYTGQESIVKELVKNFLKDEHPVLASTIMMSQISIKAARDATETNPCVRQTPNAHGRVHMCTRHAVVITGICIVGVEPLTINVQIKNSWGVRWGISGHTWVTSEFIESIQIPDMRITSRDSESKLNNNRSAVLDAIESSNPLHNSMNIWTYYMDLVSSVPKVCAGRFKESSETREQSIIECMIVNLVEKYNVYNKYPDKQPKLASALFDSKIFVFGTKALEKYEGRLIEWHLHPELVSFTERDLTRSSAGHPDSYVAAYNQQHHNSISQPDVTLQQSYLDVTTSSCMKPNSTTSLGCSTLIISLSLIQFDEDSGFILAPVLSDELQDSELLRNMDFFSEANENEFVAILAEVEKENNMADRLKELGYKGTLHVSLCKGRHVRGALHDIIENLDHEGFYVPGEAAFSLLISCYKQASQDPSPLSAVWGNVWRNNEGHLSSLKYAISVPPEVFMFAHCNRQLANVDAVKSFILVMPIMHGSALIYWRSFCLCQLAERGLAKSVQALLEYPLKHCPEVLPCWMAHVNTPYDLLQHEATLAVVPWILKDPSVGGILLHLWHVNQPFLLTALNDALNMDSENITRILGHELKIISPVLDMVPMFLGIRLAALVSRKQFRELEQWLSSNVSTYKDTLFEECLRFLKEVEFGAQESSNRLHDSGNF